VSSSSSSSSSSQEVKLLYTLVLPAKPL
jgi:hypothetical protein